MILNLTFDLTFDYTFQGIVVNQDPPTETPNCETRQRGAYLTWFTPHGWAYWLFTGYGSYGDEVGATGSFERNGLMVYTEKKTRQQITIRTEGLTREESEYVTGIVRSPKVLVLAPDADNKFHAVEVSIDPGSFGKWEDSSNRTYIAVTIKFATVNGVRV